MDELEYKGYIASIEYDPEIESYMGVVTNIQSPVTFYGKNYEELETEFAQSIDIWLQLCEERGIIP